MNTETLGQRLKHQMRAAGLNQTELAKRAGIERSEVNRIVNDKRQPKHEELAWLAQALGGSVAELIDGIELPPAMQKTVSQYEEAARRVLAAEAARDEALAKSTALDEELTRERERWSRERRALEQDANAAREEAARRVASEVAKAEALARTLQAERGARADEKAQADFAIQQVCASQLALRQQLEALQQQLAKERSGKVAVGLLSGLAGLLGGAALGGSPPDDDG